MPNRYLESTRLLPVPKLHVAAALREVFNEGYTLSDLRADLAAGTVVGLVAIPLAMALAIASGVPPQVGLYTAIFSGGLIALLGGSRWQVSGPTAAFVVVLAPITNQYGYTGLLLATVLAGLLLLIMGIARLGKFIQFVPHPVTTGFTAGIAVVLATLQLKDVLGLRTGALPDSYAEKLIVLAKALPSFHAWELGIALLTLGVLILWPRVSRKIPSPIVALVVAALAAACVRKLFPSAGIDTIGSRFGGIPRSIPHFAFPWQLRDSSSMPMALSLSTIKSLMPPAFTIAVLGAIESLLSATVADGMKRTKHDPDAELVGQGLGNLVGPFFGGIAATGAIARTATNIRFGARSPISGFVHAVFILLVIFLFAPWVSYLPMAALAALLLLVAYNMFELKHALHILRVAPRSDVAVLLLCFGLTVIFDMVTGVTIGVVLAAFLFMKRMASVTSLQEVSAAHHPALKAGIPKEIVVYEVAGPLFFGAAETAVDAIDRITDRIDTVIFVMEDVPVMDVTGLVAFESALAKLKAHKRNVYLVGLKRDVFGLLKRARVIGKDGTIKSRLTLEEAITDAKLELAGKKKPAEIAGFLRTE